MTAKLPAPSTIFEGEPTGVEYRLQCTEWARGLSESNLRSLASDYKLGNYTPDNRDAYYEFKRREEKGLLSDDTIKHAGRIPKNARKLRKGR